jgi:hypothetical protein
MYLNPFFSISHHQKIVSSSFIFNSAMPATLSSVIESWPTPNYTNPVTRGTALYVIAIILSVVSVLIVAARLWARLVIVRKPGLDDGLVVVALVRRFGAHILLRITTYSIFRASESHKRQS